MPAVAITDHGVMYGVMDFDKTAAKETPDIKPIIGCEFYINAHAPCTARDPHLAYHHLVLLAKDKTGYMNLAKLNSIAHLKGSYYKPRIDKESLRAHKDGVICLSACLQGELACALRDEQYEQAREIAAEHLEIFGPENYFLEMQDHGIPEQKIVNDGIRRLAQELGIGKVITNDVHYLEKEHAEAHEVMLAMQTQTVMSNPNRMRYASPEFYFKSREEMEEKFPDDQDALDNTVKIAEMCEYRFKKGVSHYPKWTHTDEVTLPDGGKKTRERQATVEEAKADLVRIAGIGLKEFYGIEDVTAPKDEREEKIAERFFYELGIIEKTGFIDYFLVVADFVNYAISQGIPVGPGRGSGGGSVVAYCMKITRIDPLRFNLVFERFLNPERVSPPDFDIDFCQSRRGEVIEYVRQKYGADRVAQIATFGQLGAKTVIRDIARALEIPLDKSMKLTKLVPEAVNITLTKAMEESPEFKDACTKDPDMQRILPYALVLEGLYRNTGMHAAGVVIGDSPLIDVVPMTSDKSGEPMTQFAKTEVEECGLLKMDFLGLQTLTILKEATDLVKKTHGIDVDLDKIPEGDPKTYELLNRADTKGVFQLESEGMRSLILRIGVNNIEDIVAVIALYRPGPMEMLPSYSARKLGEEKVVYDHPLLEPILKSTYGVIVYQEQVQRAANVLAGYSLGQADILRRAMGKKKPEVMAAERAHFIEGCREKNNISQELAENIFDNIAAFAKYGFNQAHSVGYGIICYQTAYMKANYPAEYMAAQISGVIGNFDKLPDFITEAGSMGLPVLRPDVNKSWSRFIPEGEGIRYGLAGIKGVGEMAAEAIVNEREANGPFTGLLDFCDRLDSKAAGKRVLESLIRCGAMDTFGKHRAQLFSAIEFALAHGERTRAEKESGQLSLFGDIASNNNSADTEDLPEVPKWTPMELLSAEKELLGVYLSGYPLDRYRTVVEDLATISIQDAMQATNERSIEVRIAGLASSVQKKITKKKEPMAIIVLEDGDARIDACLFPRSYGANIEQAKVDEPLLAIGELKLHNERPSFSVREVHLLTDAIPLMTKSIHIPIPAEATGKMQALAEILRAHHGKTPVEVGVPDEHGRRVWLDLPPELRVEPDFKLIDEVEHLLGRKTIRLRT